MSKVPKYSIRLLDEFLSETPKNDLDKLIADIDDMYADDVSFEEYVKKLKE